MADLRKSMDWSLKQLKPFRKNRLKALRHMVGKNYSDSTSEKVPLNMVWLAIGIYLRQLVPANPQSSVSTTVPDLKPVAAKMEIAINHLLNEIHYSSTLKMVVMEAMLSMGILKVGLEVNSVGDEISMDHDAGQPFADAITLDHWVHDMTAKDYRKVSYAGDRYSIPYELAMEMYSGTARDRLVPRDLSTDGSYGIGESGAETLSQGKEGMKDEFGQFVDLWDIWLPRDNLFMTIPAGGNQGPPLEVKEWEGPENGMYHLLRFQPIPDNIMPIGPVMQWLDMAEGVNSTWRKLGRQADRQKEVTFVQGSAMVDGNSIRNANDGDIISVNNPQGIHQVRYGGIDQQNLGFSINSKNVLTYLMGNINAIGGLSAQTSTLGQAQMLSGSANRMIDDMRQELAYFNQGAFNDLAMYMWEDPYIDIPLVRRAHGIDIPFRWTNESHEGDFAQYNFEVEPFSQRVSSPEERLSKMNEVMTQIVIPSGMQFDHQKYLSAVAKLLGSKELEDILQTNPTAQPVKPQGEEAKASVNTTRTYERISRAGPSTKSADDQMLQQAMLGGGQGQPGPSQLGNM